MYWVFVVSAYLWYKFDIKEDNFFHYLKLWHKKSFWLQFWACCSSPSCLDCSIFFTNGSKFNICLSWMQSFRKKIGELVDNPDQTSLPNGNKRRCVWFQRTGVVVAADGLCKWKVLIDHSNTVVLITTTTLKILEQSAGLPMVSTLYNIVITYLLFFV